MKRALLAIYTDGHFTELSRVARLLDRSGTWQPVLHFARAYAQKERDLRTCQAEGWRYVDLAPSPQTGSAGAARSPCSTSASLAACVKAILRAAVVRLPFPFTVVRAILRQGQHLWRDRRVVLTHRPDVVVLCEDTVGYETATLIKAAHESGVATVIVPFTVANALEPAELYLRDPQFDADRGTNRIAARLYPRWVYSYRGRRLLRLPAPQLFAKEWWGLAPPLPWTFNSGSADVLAAESGFMVSYYRREGLPPPRLVLTGAVADDDLAAGVRQARVNRRRLCEELGLPVDKPLLVCALPPDQFSLIGAQAEFADYAEMVAFWAQTLGALSGWGVVVRLHPRVDASQYRYVEQWGPKICQWDTATLVALCDLYVACVSATIRWAIACGKPVVNYDVYRVRWTDYADAPGVLRVEDKAEFEGVVRRLTTDPASYASVLAKQQADAPRWGTLDGRAAARLLQLLDGLGTPAAAARVRNKEASS